METCGSLAYMDPVTGKLTAYITSQAPHAHRTVYAHVAGLAAAGLLTDSEADVLVAALNQVEEELNGGTFHFLPTDEDIHTAVERRVTELSGDLQRLEDRLAASAQDAERTGARMDRVTENLWASLRDLRGQLAAARSGSKEALAGVGAAAAEAHLGELVHRTGCQLLCDVSNVYLSAHNMGYDAYRFLDGLPVEVSKIARVSASTGQWSSRRCDAGRLSMFKVRRVRSDREPLQGASQSLFRPRQTAHQRRACTRGGFSRA